MIPYLALQIMKGKLDYVAVVTKFPLYKDKIDTILIFENKADLIRE